MLVYYIIIAFTATEQITIPIDISIWLIKLRWQQNASSGESDTQNLLQLLSSLLQL